MIFRTVVKKVHDNYTTIAMMWRGAIPRCDYHICKSVPGSINTELGNESVPMLAISVAVLAEILLSSP